MLHWLRSAWNTIFRKAELDRELEEELHSYVEMMSEEKIREGMTPEDAFLRVRSDTGGIDAVKQRVRDVRVGVRIERLLQDIHYGFRVLIRSAGFSVVAVTTLALGIGANTAMFTVADSILMRPLPFPHQDRLMRVTASTGSVYPKGWIRALGDSSRSFVSLAGFGPDTEYNVSEEGRPDRVFGARITTNAFDTLGIHPLLGAFFSAHNAIFGQDNDVVVSYSYWHQHFGGSSQVVGKTMRIDGISRRVIGVLPEGVRFPYGDTQFVLPVSYRLNEPNDQWASFDLQMFGRLTEGVTAAQAQAELRRLHDQLLPTFPWRMPDIWASDMTVISLLELQTGKIRPRLFLLLGAVILVLLIACANVANLMLARATARERELAIRSAVGASGRRLVQQLLAESIVVGLVAGVVGLVVSASSLRLLVRLLPADTPRIETVSIRPTDLLFALGISILAGILFGLIPSIKMASLNLLASLRTGSRGIDSRSTGFGISMALVITQIALSVVVIASAGLMLRSLYQLSRVDPGFRTNGVVTAEIPLDGSACMTPGRCSSFYQTLLDRLQGIPGLENVALTDNLPLSGLDNNYVYDAENHPRDSRQGALLATGRIVTPGYFEVLGLHLVRGRLLDASDASGASHAVVVNERMAQRLWPGQNPLGKHVLEVNDAPSPAVWNLDKASIIVGVVRNARTTSLTGGYSDEIYLPMTKAREQPDMDVVLRSRSTPRLAAEGLRRIVGTIDSGVPVTRIRTLDEVVAGTVVAPRALALLLLVFGGLAVVIGAIGIYSLISYVISWRIPEIGLRLALGAQPWQIQLAVVRQSLWLAGGGCVSGLLVTLGLSRLLHSFLFEVSAVDPITLGAVVVLIGAIALAAAWVPARRAAMVDPMVAIRGE